MADEHETESQAWAIEAAAAEAASRAAEEVHRPPVVPMERVVDRTDIERGERAAKSVARSQASRAFCRAQSGPDSYGFCHRCV